MLSCSCSSALPTGHTSYHRWCIIGLTCTVFYQLDIWVHSYMNKIIIWCTHTLVHTAKLSLFPVTRKPQTCPIYYNIEEHTTRTLLHRNSRNTSTPKTRQHKNNKNNYDTDGAILSLYLKAEPLFRAFRSANRRDVGWLPHIRRFAAVGAGCVVASVVLSSSFRAGRRAQTDGIYPTSSGCACFGRQSLRLPFVRETNCLYIGVQTLVCTSTVIIRRACGHIVLRHEGRTEVATTYIINVHMPSTP